MQFDTVIRAQAAQATIDKFFSKPLIWGKRDCVRMAAFALMEMGHADQLRGVKSYSTPLGAKRAMKAAGVKDFAAHLDRMGFERIGYASALPGDLVGFPGAFHRADDESLALGVFIDHNRILGFAPGPNGAVCGWASADQVVTHAWRVPVLRTDVGPIIEPESVHPPTKPEAV